MAVAAMMVAVAVVVVKAVVVVLLPLVVVCFGMFVCGCVSPSLVNTKINQNQQ